MAEYVTTTLPKCPDTASVYEHLRQSPQHLSPWPATKYCVVSYIQRYADCKIYWEITQNNWENDSESKDQRLRLLPGKHQITPEVISLHGKPFSISWSTEEVDREWHINRRILYKIDGMKEPEKKWFPVWGSTACIYIREIKQWIPAAFLTTVKNKNTPYLQKLREVTAEKRYLRRTVNPFYI
jgi:hypothetical protein